jgi:lipoate-protein ligase A
MSEWLHLKSPAREAGFNMALDEALLESAVRLSRPVLRFYSWTEPAASFGYFQKIAEVERQTHLRPLVRRPTAGGIVPHDSDWTYSVIIPPGNEWYSLTAVESYRRAHLWQQRAFARSGVETELAPCCKRTAPGQCFEGYEQFDLLWRGRKIAGAAQRRNKFGLLIQGSVQPPLGQNLKREDWEEQVLAAGTEEAGIRWETLRLDGPLLNRIRELSEGKYARVEYNRKR